MKRSLICLLLSFFNILTFTVFAQQPGGGYSGPRPDPIGIVKGKVLDQQTNEALPYTNVILYNQSDSSMVTGTIAGEDGTFTINKVPLGRYYVEVKFIGYDKKVINDVRILPQKSSLDLGVIKINPSSQQLKEVQVSAEKPPVEYQIDKKVVNISDNMSSMGNSLALALENTPSINVDIDGNVSLRGSTNFQVLIDGKPSPLSGSDALQQIPASAVQSVEIITNPSAKYDPDGLGGIINIITKKKSLEGFSGAVNASIGTHNKYREDATVTFKSDKFTIYAGGDYINEDRTGTEKRVSTTYLPDTTQYIVNNGTGDWIRHGYSVKGGITYSPNKNNSFSLESRIGNHGFDRKDFGKYHEYSMPADSDLYYLDNSNGGHSENYTEFTATYDRSFNSPKHKLTTYVQFRHSPGSSNDNQDEIFTDKNFNPINIDPYRIRTPQSGNEVHWRLQSDYTRPVGDKGKLEAGYQMRIDRENSDYNFLEFNNTENEWVENPIFKDAMNFRRDIHGLYTTFSDEISTFGYELGLRGEYTYRNVQNLKADQPAVVDRLDFFPTVHLSEKIGKQDQIMASYSKRINRPHGWDLDPFPRYIDPNTTRIGNPKLLPEYVDSYELSYQKGIGNSYITLEGYYRMTRNGITRIMQVQDNGHRLFTNENLNKERAMGGEAMFDVQFTPWFHFNANADVYKYQLEGNASDTTVVAKSNNSNFRLNADFKITPTTKFQIQGFYRGPTVTVQGKREKFWVTNASIRQDFFHNKLSATLQIRDILGTGKFRFVSQGTGFMDQFNFARESQVLRLTLSYRINNYKNKNRGPNGNEQQPAEDSGGMMMDQQ